MLQGVLRADQLCQLGTFKSFSVPKFGNLFRRGQKTIYPVLQNTFVEGCIARPFFVPSATQFAHDCMAAKNIYGDLLAMNFATQSTATLRLSKCHKSSKQHHVFSALLKI